MLMLYEQRDLSGDDAATFFPEVAFRLFLLFGS